MDKDRVKGSADQAMGAIKEAAGELTGDAKLKAEGKAGKLKGKVENASAGRKTLSGTRPGNWTRVGHRCRGKRRVGLRDAVRTRPVGTLAVAAGIGALVGALIMRV